MTHDQEALRHLHDRVTGFWQPGSEEAVMQEPGRKTDLSERLLQLVRLRLRVHRELPRHEASGYTGTDAEVSGWTHTHTHTLKKRNRCILRRYHHRLESTSCSLCPRPHVARCRSVGQKNNSTNFSVPIRSCIVYSGTGERGGEGKGQEE